jgi:phospholipid/cholesterol/gamma-HCH transport system substrate-binding protein
VGLTVLAASVTLAILILLMSGTGGIFTRKILIRSYFDNASGLRVGAPVRLEGVDIGNVKGIRIVPDPARHAAPVEVTMKVSTQYENGVRRDSVTSLETAGVLGETFIDINSSLARGPAVRDGDELSTRDTPDIQDVVRASQTTLQNMNALLKRLDNIVAFVESGQGSIGKVIYDPGLYNRLNATVGQFQGLVADVSNGKGSLGRLFTSDELYDKANSTIDNLNTIVSEINSGKGTVGKFLKDPALYNDAHSTVANLKSLTDDINAGKGTLGKLTKDQEFADKLQKTMNNVESLTSRLEAGEGTAGKLLHDPNLYNHSDQLLVETQALVQAIRTDPKKYLTIRVKIF